MCDLDLLSRLLAAISSLSYSNSEKTRMSGCRSSPIFISSIDPLLSHLSFHCMQVTVLIKEVEIAPSWLLSQLCWANLKNGEPGSSIHIFYVWMKLEFVWLSLEWSNWFELSVNPIRSRPLVKMLFPSSNLFFSLTVSYLPLMYQNLLADSLSLVFPYDPMIPHFCNWRAFEWKQSVETYSWIEDNPLPWLYSTTVTTFCFLARTRGVSLSARVLFLRLRSLRSSFIFISCFVCLSLWISFGTWRCLTIRRISGRCWNFWINLAEWSNFLLSEGKTYSEIRSNWGN